MPFIGRGGSSPPSDTTQWDSPHRQVAPAGGAVAVSDTPGTVRVPVPDAPIPDTNPPGAPPPPIPRCGVAADLLAAATAHLCASRTDTGMPNAAPPPRFDRPNPVPAHGSAPAACPDGLPRVPSPSAAAAPLTAGLPSSWHGAAELLATTAASLGTRAPVNTELLEAAAAPVPTTELAAIWSVPQAPGRRDGRVVLRRLEGKGRLMLPLTLTGQTRTAAPAERAGAVLTVYLPGSPAEPTASRVVAPCRSTRTAGSRSPGPHGPSSAGSPAPTC